MGYNTDIIGHAEVVPALNLAEEEYLLAFAESRRCDRPGGPYEVPDNPKLDLKLSGDEYNRPAPDQPGSWCHWEPSCGGRCLTYNGSEKFYAPAAWLQYLIDHFLKPGAQASTVDDQVFAKFTFDHAANGVFAACRRDTARLWLIRVTDNVVTEEVLVEGASEWPSGPHPYEDEIDRWRDG